MLNISGVVVLYHPDVSVVSNIQSYIDYIDRLYVVDNSTVVNAKIVAQIKNNNKCVYVNDNENLGLALALNVGAEMAMADAAEWLLTMDQDSRFEEGALLQMIQWLNEQAEAEVGAGIYVYIKGVTNIGIISPVHNTARSSENVSDDVVEATLAMTSGNLLNLAAFKTIGPFREDFFIDYIDFEYCLRLNNAGYKILIYGKGVLQHRLGEPEQVRFLWFDVLYMNHNRVRRYYITRNRLKIIKEYWRTQPVYCLKDVKYFISSWLKIVCLDENAVAKQKAILLGIKHFFQGKSGKLSEEDCLCLYDEGEKDGSVGR
ncbi:MAG: glycosyltransferase family 2 protein [Thiotrichaceae bacterium]|nr:glycosyltransferase family 2 protein [Thiotrichaceae bacterium]